MLRTTERTVYAKLMLSDDKFDLLESNTNDAPWAYYYARDVLKERWPEGEAVIAADGLWAYAYAKDVINGRFPEGESVIAKDAEAAHFYSMDIIQGRFPEGEAVITINQFWKERYDKVYG